MINKKKKNEKYGASKTSCPYRFVQTELETDASCRAVTEFDPCRYSREKCKYKKDNIEQICKHGEAKIGHFTLC